MRLAVDGAHELQVFNHVEPALSHLGLGDVGLGLAQAPGQLLLCDAARLSLGPHPDDQVAVLRGMGGFQDGGRKSVATYINPLGDYPNLGYAGPAQEA